MPIPVPMGGGMRFGYPSFGVPGVSFYGGGFGLSPVDILLLGGVAYGLAKANQVRVLLCCAVLICRSMLAVMWF